MGGGISVKTKRFRNLFIGSDGLRAGWSILGLFVFAILSALALVAITFVLPVHKPGGPYGIPALIGAMHLAAPELIGAWTIWSALPFGCATAAMVFLERLRWSDFGFKGGGWGFFQGLVAGVGSVAVLVAGLRLTGALAIDHVGFVGAGAATWALRWAFAFLMVGASEELVFRGFVFWTLIRGLNVWWATTITSVWFMTFHLRNDGETAMGLAGVTLFGAVAALSIWRSGSIWWAIGYHAAFDWAESFLFGVGDSGTPASHALLATHPTGPAWLSGGTAGPEGSILLVPVLVITGIWIFGVKKDGRASLFPRAGFGAGPSRSAD